MALIIIVITSDLTCRKLQGHEPAKKLNTTPKTERQRLYEDLKICVLRCLLKVFN